MAKFPQIEWIEIDGQMWPTTKPQHYKKGSTTETELTGHDNPLPTADYGMTESGVWIPKRVSDDGAQHTQLTGSIVELFNESVEVSAGAFVGVTPNFENEDYREAWCTCVADKEHDFELRLQMRENHHNMFQFTNDNDVSSISIGGNLQTVLPKLFITSHIRVAIRNNDLEDRSYQINLRVE